MTNSPSSREISRRAWAIFWIGSLGFVLSMFYRLSITVISPELTRDLNLNTAQLSQLSAAFFYAFAFSQIPIGLALDSIGPRAVVVLLNVAGVAGAVFFASAQTAGQAYWARFLIGIGMSGNLMGLLTLLAAWFPAHRFATIGGLFVGIGSAGSMLAATPLALLARAFGWRGSFLLIALINALQVLAFLVFVRNRPPDKEGSTTSRANPFKGLWLVLKFPSYWWISIGAFFRYGCLTALQGLWAGPYLINGLGFSTLEAGNALFFMGLSYMVGLPLSGRLSDRVARSRKWVILPSLFITALLFLSLMVWPRGAPAGGPLSGFFFLGVFYGSRADHVFPYQGTGPPAGHVHGYDRNQPLHHAGAGLYHAGHGPGGGVRAAGLEQPGRVCPGLGLLRRRPGVFGVAVSFGAG